MLGDIVPNNTNPNGTATATRPVKPATGGGYGTSEFGDARQPASSRPVAKPASSPMHQVAPSRPNTAPTPSVTREAASAPVSARAAVTALPTATKKRATKVPLVLTIIGVLVFIGGVSGLFIYALGGQ